MVVDVKEDLKEEPIQEAVVAKEELAPLQVEPMEVEEESKPVLIVEPELPELPLDILPNQDTPEPPEPDSKEMLVAELQAVLLGELGEELLKEAEAKVTNFTPISLFEIS